MIYYADDVVTLHLGDCREVTEWLTADVLIMDPPYGIRYNRRHGVTRGWAMPAERADGIDGDQDTSLRDWVLSQWRGPAAVFGSLMLPPPAGTRKVCVYRKPPDSGTHGALGGFRHDIEGIYLIGKWPAGVGGRSSVIDTAARTSGNPAGLAARYGHPNAKPEDVMETLLAACPSGAVIADPTAGTGSTLVAARNLGHPAIGVEIEEPYCRRAAGRLAQDVLTRQPVRPCRDRPRYVPPVPPGMDTLFDEAGEAS
jgi:site-specific DNA-methyltransferase (adenine-specific)